MEKPIFSDARSTSPPPRRGSTEPVTSLITIGFDLVGLKDNFGTGIVAFRVMGEEQGGTCGYFAQVRDSPGKRSVRAFGAP